MNTSMKQETRRSSPSTTTVCVQHERLVLELLPFKDAAKESDPDKNKTAEAARHAIRSRSIKFLVFHPNKTTWTAEDHHVRFIGTMIQDNMLCGLWSDSDWKGRELEMCRAVFEVLCFLKATCLAAEEPPCYSQ
ncbi:hypothetical protein E4U53_007035 [Claviceps sorghi]|nr:hypothetical protein E4U53_007035 [Claviceps sorghi]